MAEKEFQELMESPLTPLVAEHTLAAVEKQERPRFERKKRVSVNTYQEGWIEWRRKKDGTRLFRIRYWIRDESSPSGWKKVARPWQEGSSKKAAGRATESCSSCVQVSFLSAGGSRLSIAVTISKAMDGSRTCSLSVSRYK